MIKSLPAGLTDSNAEFFVTPNLEPKCLIGGQSLGFEKFNEQLISALTEKLFGSHKEKVAIYKVMTGSDDPVVILKQFVFCCYGGFDCKPDLVDGKLKDTEYWICPLRGSCQFDGKGCKPLTTKSGVTLTRRETQYVQQVALGLLDKEIAFNWNISLYTVTTHAQRVRAKLGVDRKADITRFALENYMI